MHSLCLRRVRDGVVPNVVMLFCSVRIEFWEFQILRAGRHLSWSTSVIGRTLKTSKIMSPVVSQLECEGDYVTC